jgi:hypothetical protein
MTRILWLLLCSSVLAVQDPAPPAAVRGELLDPSLHGRSWVETMDAAVQREREHPAPPGLQYVREPQNPREREVEEQKERARRESGGQSLLGGGGTSPTIGTNFVGPRVGDPGGGWIPPDTCGAVGLNHFVSVVNSNISVWNKTTGARLANVGQQAFFASPGSLGDSRVTFDPQSQRFVIVCDEFQTQVYLAVSSTSDPMGPWFKTSITISSGSDAASWPDYPTLGVDANGVYVAAYMVGGAQTMSLFAIDKAPLVAATQSLGAVTAFRGLNWEGAVQPCVTHGTPGAEYCVTYSTLYRVNPPLTAPTLTNMGTSDLGAFSAPPDAPNQGGRDLDTLDGRLMNAVFRNGFVWTAHAVASGGRSVVRWYQIDPNASVPSNRVVQAGVIDDPARYYFMPGISVNAIGNVVVGFTGSDAAQFAASYVTGRKSTDPAGQTGPVVLLKAGEGGYDDGGTPCRWGDYSLTSVDPTNDLEFWTIQEYARAGNGWGTWIGQILYDHCVPVTPTNFCVAAANSAGPGGATMSYSGTNAIAQNNFVLQTFGVPPNKTCMYLYAQDQSGFAPFGNGFRCINPPFFRVSPITTSDFVGDVFYPLDLNTLPAGGHVTSGQSWGFMLWYRDPPAGGALFNGSDGLSTTWCP